MALHRRRHRQGPDDGSKPNSTTLRVDESEGDRQSGDNQQHEDEPSPAATASAAKDAAASSGHKISSASSSWATAIAKEGTATTQSFHVTKFVILRLVGFVYLMAFVGAYNQNQGLMGLHGLVPARNYMDQLKQTFDSPIQGFLSHPTLFWFIGSSLEDWHLDATAVVGSILSFAVVLGLDSWLVMAMLWILDFSIVTVAEGNSFYAYGWESQLLETGFLSIWLCDLPSFRGYAIQGMFRDTSPSAPSLPVLWLFRWLCARISIGAGLIKLRGGECWQNKTCLYYHFESQPIPSPMSFFFHFLPKGALRRAVDLDFFVQLYSIWLVLLPGFNWYMTNLRRLGGFIQAGFMVNIILSGNFAFLTHVTIIPALACLDDDCYPRWLKNNVYQSRRIRSDQSAVPMCPKIGILRLFIDLCLVSTIGMLSVPVLTNLLQIGEKHQVMNGSFSSFKLVNTYGAFGSVGEARYEAIISLSSDAQSWTELELPCKPGNTKRRPCFCAPYHYRLDWNIWFIGFKPHQSMLQRRESWVFELIHKILLGSDTNATITERPWLSLLDPSSADFLQHGIVKYAKVDMYRYRMADTLWIIASKWQRGDDVIWWNREFEETLIRPVQIMQNGNLAYANFDSHE
mmetsp:Transcript_22968/g.49703  ORF Transcript_22968/g.49703 Transcript_22968/m.49703 type:complete len:628 (-) Transcript_22968:224-2107(-)